MLKVCTMETPYFTKLKDDLKGMDFKGHRVTNTKYNLQNLANMFVENVTQNLNARYDFGFFYIYFVYNKAPFK